MPPHFREVAAIPHIAPTLAVILAAIHEQPPAIVSLALMPLCNQIIPDQQVGSRAGNWSQKVLGLQFLVSPLPRKPIELFRWTNAQTSQRRGQFCVQTSH